MPRVSDKINTEIWKRAAETLPKDKWKCNICHAVNTNWMADITLLLQHDKIEFRHGLCDNCRKLADDEIIKQNKLAKDEDDKLKILSLLKASQIPPKVADSTFNKLEIREGAEIVFKTMKRLDKADRWIYVDGTNNTGKTWLVGATINYLASKNIPCYYFNERSLFRRFKDAMDNKNNESSYAIFKKIKEADIIFWDDFSIFKYTVWEMGVAYDILEFCDTYYKNIVFFSNIDLKNEIKKDLDVTKTRIGKRPLARIQKNKIHYITMKNKPFM